MASQPEFAFPRSWFVPSFGVQSKMAVVIYVCVNLLGILLIQTSHSAIAHTIKMEERDAPDFGDLLNFKSTVLPILGACLVINIAWVVKGLVDAFRRRGYLALIAATVVFAIWTTAIQIIRNSN
jgi:hypothetical protein